MIKWFSENLTGRLTAYFTIVALFPGFIVGYLAFSVARSALMEAEFERLVAERDLRRSELLNYFEGTLQTLQFMADTPAVKSATETLTSYHEYGRSSENAPFNVSSELYEQMYKQIHPFFESLKITHPESSSGYLDFLIVSANEGNVMYTAKRLSDLGTSLKSGELKESGCARMWEKTLKTSAPATMDMSVYQPDKRQSLFMGVPILGADKTVLGVLAVRLGTERIDKIFSPRDGSVRKVAAFLVGSDYLLKSQGHVRKGVSVPSAMLNTRVSEESRQWRFRSRCRD